MGLTSAAELQNGVTFLILAILCFCKGHERIGALVFIIGVICLIEAFF